MLQGFDLKYYISVFWARFPLFVAIFAVVSVAFAAVALLLPAKYDARARIIVESQQIPDELARSTITAQAQERIRVIEQRIMTRQNLIDIAKRLNVYDRRLNLPPGDIVNRMIDATEFDVVSLGGTRRNPGATAFSVSFTSNSANTAAAVANEYVSLILNQNVKLRTDQATETLSFFEQENERLTQELSVIERQIAEFKRSNRDTLPERVDFHIATIRSAQDRLVGITREYSEINEARQVIETSRSDPRMFANIEQKNLTPLEQELQSLELVLSAKRAVLSEQHPEMKALTARYSKLQAEVARSQEQGLPANSTSDDEVSTAADSAATLISMELERQELALDLRQKRLEEEQAILEERIADAENAISAAPNTEAALNNLLRQQDIISGQYEVAVAKLSRAEVGEQLEVRQQAERFELLEAATKPNRPTSPNRILIIGLGVMTGVVAGFAVVFGIEFASRTVRRPSDLINRLDIEPIAIIPYIYTDQEAKKMRRIRWFGITFFAVLAIGSIWAVDQFYLPIDVLVQRFGERLGLEEITGGMLELESNSN